MSREEEIRNIRIGKISRLEEAGMDAYVPEAKLDISLREARERFSELEEGGEERTLMGRILSKRSAGKIAFATLFDGTGKFQVVLKQDELGKERMKQFEKLFDIGDFAAFT
jgi:lysyl-tRNA synthetase class 2